MNEIVPLTRPLQSQITIDSVAKECPSDGFNYPKFSLLNKHARAFLSKPLQLESGLPYQLFDIANSKGWFVAVKQTNLGAELIFSTLEDLRGALNEAKEDSGVLFNPKRTLTTPSKANIVKFACSDTRLLVGQDNGSILLYDTEQLFTQGEFEVYPLTSTHIQTTYLRHIVPNPGNEPGLSDLVAIVANEKVQLVNGQLEPQGGWEATDDATQPISVDWSPKGKHIAIGIKTGDILTFSLTNRATPHKHIPPTAGGPLVSLQWLGPGHTFRTTYINAVQHIIVLEAKSASAIYYAPEHPYPVSDRPTQNAYTISLPKWDTDASSSDDSKALTIVGDLSSIDIEVLGNSANTWFRHSQDNPVTLPLDSAMEDTYLLSLELDLTDSTTGQPIVYAYLNDGSVQGWHLESSKPYAGMISSASASTAMESGKDTDMSADTTAPTPTAFGQTTSTSHSFGQSSFTSQTSSFSTQTSSAFGQSSFGAKPATTSAFGQSSFGQPSTFGQPAASSAFGSAQPASGFAAFGSSGGNAFGSGGAFGSSAFGSQTTGSAFGQSSFGNNSSALSASGNQIETSTDMTREASMSDSTPAFSGGFGGLSLGGGHPTDPKASNNMFGSFGSASSTTPAAQTSSGFGGSILKPATGFGAFGAGKTTSAFSNPAAPTVTAFGSAPASTTTPAPGSGFGQSGFGGAAANPAFGKSAFGQPAFGSSTFGKPSLAAPAASSGGAFAAFASAPTNSLTGAAQTATPATSGSSGGFAAFANQPTGFGTAASSGESKPASGFGAFASSTPSAFGSSATGSVFGSASSSTPAFGSASGTPAPAFGSTASSDTKEVSTPAAFGTASSTPASVSTSTPETPAKSESAKNIFGGPNIVTPLAPTGTPKDSVLFSPTEQKTPDTTTNVFSGIKTTASPFAKPASGFGAFGNTTPSKDSPFYKKPEETPTKPISVFGTTGASTSTTPAAPTPSKGLAFGAPSALGATKSAFATATTSSLTTPTKAPATGGFSAFSGNNSGFASLTGKPTSFGALLKSSGNEIKEASAPALSDGADANKPKDDEEKGKAPADVEQKPRTSVLNTPLTPPKRDALKQDGSSESVSTQPTKDGNKGGVQTERTLEWVSGTSGGSSFVEVDARDAREERRESDDDYVPHSDDDSFLTDDSEQPDLPLDDEEEEAEHEEQEHEEGEVEDEDEEDEDELEEGEGEEEEDLEETDIPASVRSPSATPQPEAPAIRVTGDTSETPTKAGAGVSHSPSSPFSLGLGRPSTRPTRSSPLAKAVSNDDEESEQEGTNENSSKKPAASPRSPVAVVPLKAADDDDKDSATKRPKTPPLLSTLGAIAAPVPSIFGQTSGSIFGQTAPTTKSSSISPSSESASKDAPSFSLKMPEAGTSLPNFFGQPPNAQVKAEPPRPATVPATGGLGIPPPIFASSPFEFPSFPKAASSTPNVFSAIKTSTFPPATSAPSPIPAPTSVFGAAGSGLSGASPSANMFGPKQAATTTFGGQPATPSPLGPKPPAISPPAMFPSTTSFGNQAQLAAGTPPKPVQPTPAVSPAAGVISSTSTGSPSRPQEPENSMQQACRTILINLEQDILELRKMMIPFAARINGLCEPRAGGTTISALSKPENWSLENVKLFGEVLLQYGEELDLLETERETYEKQARDVQNSLVKVGMKKEEVSRFMKAKNDKEFAKMLKSRALGPEHSEMQARLRKSVRMMRDRVQKLETRLAESKKKLAEANSCKPSFKPPTIDTINRTYRNVEIALEQQSDEISRLASRISHLKVDEAGEPVAPSTLARGGSAQHERTPQSQQRPYNISTSVAETTAAALNGERSAARLKRVLLRVRTEPLLNTQALNAPPPTLAYDSPRKPSPSAFGASAFDSLAFGKPFEYLSPPTNEFDAALGDASVESPNELNKMLDFSNLPDEDEFHLADLSESSGRRAGRARSHKYTNPKKGVPFVPKTPQTQASPPPPPAFDWGPLPKFGTNLSPPVITPPKFMSLAPPNPGGSTAPTLAAPNFFASPSPPSKATFPMPKGFVSFSSPSSGSR